MNVLLFDYDGTIADTTKLAVALVHNIHLSFGTPDATKSEDIKPFYANNFFDYLLGHGLKKEQLPDVVENIATFLAPIYNEAPYYDDMPAILKKLSNKYIIYIITSGDTKVILEHLKKGKLTSTIKEVLGADKGIHKTDKIELVKKMHLGAEFFYIGDTTGDIREGKKTGVKTIAVTWGTHSKELLQKENPDKLVDTPQELLDYLYSLQV